MEVGIANLLPSRERSLHKVVVDPIVNNGSSLSPLSTWIHKDRKTCSSTYYMLLDGITDTVMMTEFVTAVTLNAVLDFG